MGSPFDSNLLNLSNCQQIIGGAALYNGGYLSYFFADQNNNLNVATNRISNFLQSKNTEQLQTWGVTQLQSLVPYQTVIKFQTSVPTAAVSLYDFNYLFWVDASGNISAARCSPDMSQFELASINFRKLAYTPIEPGSLLGSLKGNVSACILPDGAGIALQFLAICPESYPVNPQYTVPKGASLFVTCVLRPGDFPDVSNPSGSWSGFYDAIMLDSSGAVASNFNTISANWFTQGLVLTGDDGNATGQHDIVVGFYGNKNAQCLTWQVSDQLYANLNIYGDNKPRSIPVHLTDQTPLTVAGIGGSSDSLSRGVFVTRDPAGAVIGLYCFTMANRNPTPLYKRNISIRVRETQPIPS